MRFLTRSILALAAVATVAASAPATAEVGIGADVVSRYIFRGTDFGKAVTVQPGLTFDGQLRDRRLVLMGPSTGGCQ